MLPLYFYDEAKKEIDEKIKEERTQYNEIYEKIENYIIKEKIITIKDGVIYNLYSYDMVHYAHELANILYKDNPYVVVLNTQIPYKHIVIYINHRIFVNFYMCDRNEYIPHIESSNGMTILSPEMELLIIYHKLYSITNAKQWRELSDVEKVLYKNIKLPNMKEKIIKYTENKYKNVLLTKLIQNNNIVLIGELAVKLSTPINDDSPIKIIIEGSFIDLYKEIEQILIKFDSSVDISKKISNVKILEDQDLSRMIVKVNNIEILYVYNSASYELIPYNKISSNGDFIYVAHPWVIMRFLLIDWAILYKLGVMGILSNPNIMMNHILIIYNTIRNIWINQFQQNPMILYEDYPYFGQYVNFVIKHKIEAIEENAMIGDYVPEAYINKFGQLRTIQKM